MSDAVEAKYDHAESPVLVITFGCAALRQSAKCLYGFIGVLGNHDVKKLFIKDSKTAWFLRGIVGISDNTPACAKAIKLFARMMGVERIITIGSSMGAYGALLYGNLLRADVVLAFGPQTAIDPATAEWCRDGKIKYYKEHVYPYMENQKYIMRYLDLSNRMIRWNGKTEYHTFRSSTHRMDRYQVKKIAGCPHVRQHLIPDEHKQHNIARILRERGELQKIIRAAVGGENIDIMKGVNGA